MEPVDEGVDARLRSLARADRGLAERVAAAALAADKASPRAIPRFAAVAASLVAVLVALGLGLLRGRPLKEPMIHDVTPRTVVLVRSTDGTAAIYGGAPDGQEPAPGTGFVMSEGDPR